MTRRNVPRIALGFALALPASLFAHEFSAGDLFIEHPWAAPPPPDAPSVAGYLSVTNGGESDDRLIGADAAFTRVIELHETRIGNDVVSMRELAEGVAIPAGETVVFAPSGKHLMFVSPEPLLEGEVRPVTLRFERAGPIEVLFNIEPPDAGSTDEHGDDDDASMDHSTMDHGSGDMIGMDQ